MPSGKVTVIFFGLAFSTEALEASKVVGPDRIEYSVTEKSFGRFAFR